MRVARFSEAGAFGPADIRAVSIAFDDVCSKLGLTNDEQEEREALAKRIIALARTQSCGLRDGVMRELAVSVWRGLSHSNMGPDNCARAAPRLT